MASFPHTQHRLPCRRTTLPTWTRSPVMIRTSLGHLLSGNNLLSQHSMTSLPVSEHCDKPIQSQRSPDEVATTGPIENSKQLAESLCTFIQLRATSQHAAPTAGTTHRKPALLAEKLTKTACRATKRHQKSHAETRLCSDPPSPSPSLPRSDPTNHCKFRPFQPQKRFS